MWLNKTDNSIIKKPKGLSVGEVQYPKQIFTEYSEAELNAINIFTITEDSIPNRRYYTHNDVLDNITAHITRTPIEKPLADVHALMVKEVIAKAKSLLDEAVVKYSSAEMASWDTLEKEANAFIGGELIANCPMLKDEADLCSQDYTILANGILINASTLKTYRTSIVAKRYNKVAAIMALLNIAECELYEATPGTRVITQDDVDIDNTLILGATIPTIVNNVTDWS